MFLPVSIGYWVTKNRVHSSNHPTPEKLIRIWQYLLVGFYVSVIIFLILLSQNIIEKNVKYLGILWLTWMIVYGNFRLKIEPFHEEPLHFFVGNEDIQKRSRRLSIKVIVFGGILSLILLLILPESILGYVLLGYIISFLVVPFIYGKIIQRKKLA